MLAILTYDLLDPLHLLIFAEDKGGVEAELRVPIVRNVACPDRQDFPGLAGGYGGNVGESRPKPSLLKYRPSPIYHNNLPKRPMRGSAHDQRRSIKFALNQVQCGYNYREKNNRANDRGQGDFRKYQLTVVHYFVSKLFAA